MIKLPDASTFVDGQYPPGVDPNQKYLFIDLSEYPEHFEYHGPEWNTCKFHYLNTGFVDGLYPVCFSGKEVCVWGAESGGCWRQYKEVVLIPVDDAYYELMRTMVKKVGNLNSTEEE